MEEGGRVSKLDGNGTLAVKQQCGSSETMGGTRGLQEPVLRLRRTEQAIRNREPTGNRDQEAKADGAGPRPCQDLDGGAPTKPCDRTATVRHTCRGDSYNPVQARMFWVSLHRTTSGFPPSIKSTSSNYLYKLVTFPRGISWKDRNLYM